jgi:hypothetical protein
MKRSISVRCFTFLAAPLMVERERQEEEDSVRCFTFPAAPLTVRRQRGKKRRRGREAPPSSLLLQRKERIAWAPD